MSTIFNRHNPDVKLNAEQLSLEDFIKKYENTTATVVVLTSVYKSFNKGKTASSKVAANTDAATDLVKVDKKDDDDFENIDSPAKLEEFNSGKKSSKKGGVKKGAVKEKEEKPKPEAKEEEKAAATGGDKPGRTPRMRELIKLHGKDDKQKIKRLLVEEGFNCEGSGFHSEWNRVSKQK